MTPHSAQVNIQPAAPSAFQLLHDHPNARKPEHGGPMQRRRSQKFMGIVVALTVMTLPMQSAWAAGNDEDQEEGASWGVGLGGGVMQQAYRDIDRRAFAIPLIIYDSKWLSLNGGTISLKLPSTESVSFALIADLARDGYEASDSAALIGMDERKDNFWLGGSIRWENRFADLSASWTTDVSGYSEGQKFSLSAAHSFERGRFEFTPRLTAVWLDDSYVNYYYGVKTNEIMAGRNFYVPDATVNLEAGFRTAFNFAQRNSVFVDLSVDSLGAEIKDSPLVDGSVQSRVVIGYVHMF